MLYLTWDTAQRTLILWLGPTLVVPNSQIVSALEYDTICRFKGKQCLLNPHISSYFVIFPRILNISCTPAS